MNTLLSSDDLNDFISPSVACVRPVEVLRTNESALIEIGPDGNPVERMEDGSLRTLAQAQISLTDCLACSGCITSSEEFLVQQHSPQELIKALEEKKPGRIFAVTISHQTRVSLAQALRIPLEQADALCTSLFIDKLQFRYITGLEPARAVTLQSTLEEVLHGSRSARPILSAICPGWTVYAEKTHPDLVPLLSRVKSPQQIAGLLLKHMISQQENTEPSNIFHLTVMPCFDKKLEASRDQFKLGDGAPEVDMVITARELLVLAEEYLHCPLTSLVPNFNTYAPAKWPLPDQWLSHEGTSSGGQIAFLLAAIQSRHPGSIVEILEGRNTDLQEYIMKDSQGEILFRAARVYGFRNIQNVVRKIKLKTKQIAGASRAKAVTANKKLVAGADPMSLQFIEVMACPGGCINGGGQIGAADIKESKQWIEEAEQMYRQMPKAEFPALQGLANALVGDLTAAAEKKLLMEFEPLQQPTVAVPEALTVSSQW